MGWSRVTTTLAAVSSVIRLNVTNPCTSHTLTDTHAGPAAVDGIDASAASVLLQLVQQSAAVSMHASRADFQPPASLTSLPPHVSRQ